MSDNEEEFQDGAFGQAQEQQDPEAAIPVIPGVDPATAQFIKMMMDTQAAEMKRQAADLERRLDRERFEMQSKFERDRHELERRLDSEKREKEELVKELARRENGNFKNTGKAPKFDLEKDKDNFETWKLKWEDFLISSNINSITKTGAKDEQTKAALTAGVVRRHSEVAQRSGIQPRRSQKRKFHHKEDGRTHSGYNESLRSGRRAHRTKEKLKREL